MRTLTAAFGILFLLAGLMVLGYAIAEPWFFFNTTGANAIQMTQVYSELTYHALIACAFLLAAVVCTIASYAPREAPVPYNPPQYIGGSVASNPAQR